MKKQITITLGILMALPLIFAMYGGESETIQFSFETDNCTIVPNETEGIEFTFIDNEVIVEPELNFVGSFDITCYDWLTKETETNSGESSGGGGYVKDWSTKCGYNKECLYGTKDNVTEFNATVNEDDGATIVNVSLNPEPPVIEEEPGELTTGKKVAIGFFVVIAIIVMVWLAKKLSKKEEEIDLNFEGANELNLGDENARTK